MNPYISMIIPAYNEEVVIEKTLMLIVEYFEVKDIHYEIIVVCDGCKDNTVSIAGRIAQRNAKIRILDKKINTGKGFSVRQGCLEAKGEYVFFSDADLSTPIEEVSKLVEWLQGDYDIAIGSRALEESDIQIHQRWYRETMGKIFNLFVQAITVKGVKDTQCGFKGFKKEIAQKIFSLQTITGFCFDVEILYIAKKHGFKIKEIPIKWLNRAESKVNPLTNSIQMLIDLFKIRLRDWNGIYDK